MKRKVGKLTLTRETLRGLDPESLKAQGGGPPTTTQAESNCNTHCVTGCGASCVTCITVQPWQCGFTWVDCA